jgi:hypothetical protein
VINEEIGIPDKPLPIIEVQRNQSADKHVNNKLQLDFIYRIRWKLHEIVAWIE